MSDGEDEGERAPGFLEEYPGFLDSTDSEGLLVICHSFVHLGFKMAARHSLSIRGSNVTPGISDSINNTPHNHALPL